MRSISFRGAILIDGFSTRLQVFGVLVKHSVVRRIDAASITHTFHPDKTYTEPSGT